MPSLNSVLNKVKDKATSFVADLKSDFLKGFGSENVTRGKSYSQYRYPDSATQPNQPFILFSHHKPTYDRAKGFQVSTELTGHIALYIPMSVQIGDSFSYDTVETGLVGTFYQQLSGGGGTSLFDNYNAETAKGIAHKFGAAAITTAAAGIGSKAGALGAIAGGGTGLAAADAALREYQKSTGVTLNPRQFMLFRTPNLRQFQLEFRFIPDSEKEANQVRSIINEFRTASYPALADGAGATFTFPDAWRIEFMNVEDMIRIPEVVITNINTTYNPNSMSYFTKGNKPVEVVLSLNFSELQPIHRELIGEFNY